MRRFLVESYVPGGEGAAVDAVVRCGAALAGGSRVIRYVGALVVVEDEVCLHVFEAPSRAALVRASVQTELERDRLVEALWLSAARALERT